MDRGAIDGGDQGFLETTAVKLKCHFAFLPINAAAANEPSSDGSVTGTIQLAKEGPMDWEGHPDYVLDRESAEDVIRDFETKGNKIPIDHHHATLLQEKGRKDQAPACGWITKLRYVPGDGLYGDVTWHKEAAEQIASKKYLYHSPVFWFDTTGRPRLLHSCALTNRPKTRELMELLTVAAEASDPNGDPVMLTDAQKKAKAVEALTAWKKTLVLCGAQEGDEIGVGMALAPEQILMVKLGEVLGLEGTASLVDLLQAALDKIGGSADGDTKGDTEAAQAVGLVAAELGVTDKKPTGKQLVEAIKGLNVKGGQVESLAARVKTTEGKLAAAEAKVTKLTEASATVDAKGFVDDLVVKGILLPDAKGQLEAAEALYLSDQPMAERVYSKMTPVAPPGRVVPDGPAPRKTRTAPTTRGAVIKAASADFDTHPETTMGSDRKSWVSAALGDEGMPECTAAELKTLEAAA